MVDKGLILRKLAEMQEYLNQVKQFGSISPAEYEADWKVQRIVERTLQMMIETCADIATHIISDLGCRTPNSYADAFRVLWENGVLSEGLLRKMEMTAGFRNVVVHRYDAVDAEIVVGILKRELGVFDEYQAVIVSFLRADEDRKRDC